MSKPATQLSVRVLVVDDDPATRMALARLIRMCGHEVITAESISDGLSKLDCNLTHVFLDMNLPDGSGTAVLWEIRARKLSAKVAVLSGTNDEDLLDEARSLVADVIFRKPTEAYLLVDWMSA